VKPIGEIKMQIEKKEVIFGGFNNDKFKKEIINITIF
jgi:hypothetical protein